jgi:hypothetical protein
MVYSQGNFQKTVDAAVRTLRGLVASDELAKITLLAEDELVTLHYGLGQLVRNYFGLWEGNPELISATGAEDADGASEVIIRELWLELRGELPKLH